MNSTSSATSSQITLYLSRQQSLSSPTKMILAKLFMDGKIDENELIQRSLWAKNILTNADPKYTSLLPETRVVMVNLCLKGVLNQNEPLEVLARTVSKLFPNLDQN